MVVILYGTEIWNYNQFRVQGCQNTHYFKKKLQMKVVQNWILYQKVRAELRIDFFILVWSINRNQISENRKKSIFWDRFNRSSKNQHHWLKPMLSVISQSNCLWSWQRASSSFLIEVGLLIETGPLEWDASAHPSLPPTNYLHHS